MTANTAASWLDSVVSLEPRKSYIRWQQFCYYKLYWFTAFILHLSHWKHEEKSKSELTSDGQVSLENDFTVSAANWTLVATARLYIAIR
ncbi:hypothetical protein T4B_10442 [Trichinella pseudospiralis]|uniref:Uncharacterized protein n=1 Tax=Trichinella pseudospiralis TaxID=6337 RepID=A0A0V1I7Y1_TRIPS|nr:hypothetical protein T4B_10442 [Trichinella pseudospiralis]